MARVCKNCGDNISGTMFSIGGGNYCTICKDEGCKIEARESDEEFKKNSGLHRQILGWIFG